ncbi:MAG: hypothetical protein ACO3FZ_06970, partial [Candidatus Nanopelagicaceae bacterium]
MGHGPILVRKKKRYFSALKLRTFEITIGEYRNIATPRPISRLRARGIKYQWGPTDSRFGDKS